MLIDTGEISLNYELNGAGDNLVLIHGFCDNIGMWYPQISLLSKYHQVLVYDFRGHGRTRTPDGEMSMEMHADDLAGLLKTLGIERTCVVGYSMGGRIGLEFALKYPQKVRGLVMANITLSAEGIKLSAKLEDLMKKHVQMMTRLIETGDIDTITDKLVAKSFSPSFQKRHPDVCKNYKALKMQNNPKYLAAALQAMLRAMQDPPDLKQISCPALLIVGEHDPYKNMELARAMQKEITQAELKILPAGHAAPIEAPEGFSREVIGFMNSLP
jgi:3-oxoadipate enol-lactonase